jgi:hypothetical protein
MLLGHLPLATTPLASSQVLPAPGAELWSSVSADGCRLPIAVAQQLGHEYPLVNPSNDIRYLLADFYLSYEDPSDYEPIGTDFVLPFRIAYLYGLGTDTGPTKPSFASTPTHGVDIVIFDANDAVVFESATNSNFREKEWTPFIYVYEWVAQAAVCRIAVHTCWYSDGVGPVVYPVNLTPTSAVLDARGVARRPKHMKSLLVGADEMSGEIELRGGYNVELVNEGRIEDLSGLLTLQGQRPDQAADGGRAGFRVEIDGTPGGGEGRFPGCDDLELLIKRINGVTANEHGDFIVSPESCIWFERPGTLTSYSGPREVDVTDNTLQLHNNCEPCCKCEDFVATKQTIDRIYTDYVELAGIAESIRDIYKLNRQRWVDSKNCREADPQRLALVASPEGHIGVGYSFCHMEHECEGPLEVDILLEMYEYNTGGPIPATRDIQIVPRTTRKSETKVPRMELYEMHFNGTSYEASWANIWAHQAAKLTFLCKVCDAVDGDAMKVTITADMAGTEYTKEEWVTIETRSFDDDPCPA